MDVDVALVAEDFDLSADTERSIDRVLSRMANVYTGWLGLALPTPLRIDATLVASRARYDGYEATAVGLAGHTLGFFSTRTGHAYVWAGQGDEGTKDTLVHETAHWLLAIAGAARAPRWLHEGMAEAFEHAESDGNAVWLAPDPRMLDWLRSRKVPPAGDLVGGSATAWASLGPTPWQMAEYPYGWALVTFLLSSDNGRSTLGDLVLRTASGSGDAVAVLDERWPGGAAGFDRDWRGWWTGHPGRIQLPIATGGGAAEGWVRCADGSLIRPDAGLVCGRWVPDDQGVLHFVQDR